VRRAIRTRRGRPTSHRPVNPGSRSAPSTAATHPACSTASTARARGIDRSENRKRRRRKLWRRDRDLQARIARAVVAITALIESGAAIFYGNVAMTLTGERAHAGVDPTGFALNALTPGAALLPDRPGVLTRNTIRPLKEVSPAFPPGSSPVWESGIR
jgi:hypothetical protein